MNFLPLRHGAVLAALLLISGCNRAPERPAVTAEDIRIGRQAMSISEVSLLARNGYQRDALADVKRRHITEEISAEEELQLRGYASAELLAALKDPHNILTPNQKDAYDEAKSAQVMQKAQATSARNQQTSFQQQQANGQNRQAYAASSAEQQEIERRQQLQQESLRLSEARQAEQTAREHSQLRSVDARWNSIEDQNSRYRAYGTPMPFRINRPNNRPN